MRATEDLAELYLNGALVGHVHVRGRDHASWHFGDFSPLPAFAQFAPLFGRWSLLMHEDGDRGDVRLSKAAADELRETERAIDALRAKLHVPRTDAWHHPRQLNIDGTLIEWKEA